MKKAILVLITSILLGGCGVNYVAKDKNFGVTAGKKPVVGVAVAGFTLNERVNISGSQLANQFTQDMITTLQENGVAARAIPYENLKGMQFAQALSKYTSIPLLKRKNINGETTFSPLQDDLGKAGVDVLLFVSGDATVSSGSLAQLGVMLGMNAATVMLGGIGSGSTPYLMSNATVINGNGQALYANNEIFTSMGKRDFSDADHRKKFASDIAERVAKNLFR